MAVRREFIKFVSRNNQRDIKEGLFNNDLKISHHRETLAARNPLLGKLKAK
jgi:hypothetical protein